MHENEKKEKERINNEGIAARYIALAFLHTGRRADFHFQLYSDVRRTDRIPPLQREGWYLEQPVGGPVLLPEIL